MKNYNLINQRATTCRHGGHCEWVACDKCNHYEPDGLNQQPCDDCISRQAVDELSKELVHTTRDKADFLCNFWEGLQKLPSVTPKEKTGRWISFGIQGEIDGQIVRAFTCSKCGAISIFRVSNGNIVNGDLCPNCGAKMVEP